MGWKVNGLKNRFYHAAEQHKKLYRDVIHCYIVNYDYVFIMKDTDKLYLWVI
jgi:hypothetical protein